MSDGVCVIGSGAWGTAIAKLLAEKGLGVWLWTFEPELAGIIRKKRENSWYLAGIKLPAGITPTNDLADAVRGRKAVICAVPSQFVRGVMEKAGEWIRPSALLVSATKGIELRTLSRMSTIIAQAVPAGAARRLCVISGPSFAMEVARGFPTAVAVASRDHAGAKACQRLFNSPRFRVYTNDDMAGVELGGALKNVTAIAAGISDGLGFGNNARAALITRGIAEISRLGVAMGARPLTFLGLAGMGDLVLTCTGDLSRNRTVGLRIGRGESPAAILGSMKAVAEGVKTAGAAFELSRRMGVEMPITASIVAILKGGVDPRAAVDSLMSRKLKDE